MSQTITEVHANLLILLKDIDTICKQHNIKYSLFAGTLIGAVRHQGFVPWDDDADVIFERAEYEKFIKVIPSDFEIFRNPWVPRFTRKNGNNIFIDIFVFDSISDNKINQTIQIFKLKFLQGTLKNSLTLNKGIVGMFLSIVTFMIGKIFTTQQKINRYDRIAKSQNNKDTNFIFSSLDQYKYIGHILPKSIVTSYKKVDFEDTQLMIMEGFHEYLTKFYGDYMKLPDEDKRIPEHGNV